MRRKAGNTPSINANQGRKAEPRATTAANWWERDLGELLRESEAARRKNGPLKFDKRVVIYTGYPARYNYEGASSGEFVARYLNSVITEKRFGVRFSTFESLSILSAESKKEGAERIIRLIELLGSINTEPREKRGEIARDLNRLLSIYADRQAVYVDSDQSENGSRGEVVLQRESLEYVVVDAAKLRKCVASVLRTIDELEGAADATRQSQKRGEGNNAAVLQDLRKIAQFADEAIERGPTEEEHRVHNYVIGLAERNLLNRLWRCDCSCGCAQWLFQRRGTHTMCEDCRSAHHVKNDEVRNRRNRQAQHRYQIKKGNVL